MKLSLFSTIIEKPFIPSSKRWVPVKAYSKMGMDGYFTDMGYEGNAEMGMNHSAGPRAYGIKGTGDSMFPAIRNGWYVVCDPDAELVPNEFVQVCLKGWKMHTKNLSASMVGFFKFAFCECGERFFFEMDEVESITITDIVPPSQHRQEHPYSH